MRCAKSNADCRIGAAPPIRLMAVVVALLLGACSALNRPAAPPATPGGVPASASASAATSAAASPAPAAPGAKAAKAAASTSGPVAGSPASLAAAPTPALPAVDPAAMQVFDEAVSALRAGKIEDAQGGFLALTQSHPELAGPHANLGIAYRRAGKFEEAVAELKLAVQINALQPVYWNQLGIAYRFQGQFANARAAYEKAIAVDPNYATAKLNLGVLFDLYLWDGPHALEQYQQYLALTPGGDEKVSKWIADLKNRSRAQAAKGGKERE
jgi:tetratricopeptide (TPR) repeat protein